ncbi:hypothetical protein BG261_01345 [Floricoccus tropicus]|uniref:DUF2500 domain-containing protein n=1 Tax=Floricoccus tropicus TaxID=1859473 RepID=A0A1E8GQQ7_9LACT|nr:DUF2500 domain-containing protein [Floricoccus tropicus]OFI50547.1 hypothetical protein BG261_01345 [Floricoccus tropicus]
MVNQGVSSGNETTIIVVLFFFAIVSFMFIRSFMRWSKNNNLPQVNTRARVVAKRTDVNNFNKPLTTTNYFVIFEVDSNERIEFNILGSDYGMVAEGDVGTLEYQGTIFLDFKREN